MGREDDVTYKRVANEAQRLALLDRFAVAALTGMLANRTVLNWHSPPGAEGVRVYDVLATWAWNMADAMVEARAYRTNTASPAAESLPPTPVPNP